MTREEILKDFFNTALKGESKTYNDHNWYVSNGGSTSTLKGYIEGVNQYPYGLLTKPITKYTIGEIKAFQAKPRSGYGQLWAVGRYQIIPSTLLGLTSKMRLNDSQTFNEATQDALAWQLMVERKPIADYINGVVPDTLENRQKASLEMAKIWSSIGVPYPVNGKDHNQSYYHGGGDIASVTSEIIQEKLKQLRNNFSVYLQKGVDFVKKKPLLTISLTIVVVVAVFTLYTTLKKTN